MNRQHVIHLLSLPRELITIIKEYAFYTHIESIARMNKEWVVRNISYARIVSKHSDDGLYLFWTGSLRDPQFQCYFCHVCGNYTHYRGYDRDSVYSCHCLPHF